MTPMISLAELKRFAPLPALATQFWLAETHETRTSLVEQAIKLIIADMQRNRKYHQSKDEDILTVHITSILSLIGFRASHDADSSGHPDVVVDGSDGFCWLGEAKVHSSYGWLSKGWSQLTTRYSHGGEGNAHGGLIIYCYTKNASAVLSKWSDHLESNFDGVNLGEVGTSEFRTTHTHQVSGADYFALHLIASLHYSPEDT